MERDPIKPEQNEKKDDQSEESKKKTKRNGEILAWLMARLRTERAENAENVGDDKPAGFLGKLMLRRSSEISDTESEISEISADSEEAESTSLDSETPLFVEERGLEDLSVTEVSSPISESEDALDTEASSGFETEPNEPEFTAEDGGVGGGEIDPPTPSTFEAPEPNPEEEAAPVAPATPVLATDRSGGTAEAPQHTTPTESERQTAAAHRRSTGEGFLAGGLAATIYHRWRRKREARNYERELKKKDREIEGLIKETKQNQLNNFENTVIGPQKKYEQTPAEKNNVHDRKETQKESEKPTRTARTEKTDVSKEMPSKKPDNRIENQREQEVIEKVVAVREKEVIEASDKLEAEAAKVERTRTDVLERQETVKNDESKIEKTELKQNPVVSREIISETNPEAAELRDDTSSSNMTTGGGGGNVSPLPAPANTTPKTTIGDIGLDHGDDSNPADDLVDESSNDTLIAASLFMAILLAAVIVTYLFIIR